MTIWQGAPSKWPIVQANSLATIASFAIWVAETLQKSISDNNIRLNTLATIKILHTHLTEKDTEGFLIIT